MKIETAKEIQKVMSHTESMAITLLDFQIEAGATILKLLTADIGTDVKDINICIFEKLVIYSRELREILGELENAIVPFCDRIK